MIGRKTLYRLFVLLGCAALAYLSTVVTLSNVTATSAPTVALRLWPGNAIAHAQLAENMLRENGGPAFGEVRANAVAALSRNPTLASSARDIGLLAVLRGDMAGADRRFAYADRMSRRDIPTQLWLIERRVQANDVPGALAHYGIALQVSPESQQQLFPVLASALSDRNLVQPIAGLVAQGESWRSPFLYFVNANATSLPNAAMLYLYLARSNARPDPVHIVGLMNRLVQADQLDAAGRLYMLIDPQWRRADLAAQLDGGFDHASDSPPLGWSLESGVAWRDARPAAAGNKALFLTVPDTATALGARRMVFLPPGAYRVTATVGRAEGTGNGTVRVALACTQPNAVASEADTAIPATTARLDGTLRVAGCDMQYLSISVERSGDPNPASTWLDDLRLVPAGHAQEARPADRQ